MDGRKLFPRRLVETSQRRVRPTKTWAAFAFGVLVICDHVQIVPGFQSTNCFSTSLPAKSRLRETAGAEDSFNTFEEKGISAGRDVATIEMYYPSSSTERFVVATTPIPTQLDVSAQKLTNNDTVALSEQQSAVMIKPAQQLENTEEYRRGLVTIGFCTLMFASMSPVMHAALNGGTHCPVVVLNAIVSLVAFLFLKVAGPFLETWIQFPLTLAPRQQQQSAKAIVNSYESNPLEKWWASIDVVSKAGLELGLWKFLGTVANLYGLSMTTADHGAFLIQLTTLIVPTVQGVMGVPVPERIRWAVGLALAGVALFTQDINSFTTAAGSSAIMETRLLGDALCVVAAVFYATYDLRLFSWGKQVAARQLITTKIAVQALLSIALLVAVGLPEATSFFQSLFSAETGNTSGAMQIVAVLLWSGIMVNAVVPFLQVGGQQAIGPTRAQTLYASQPLWAGILSWAFLGETVGVNGIVGGGAFLSALFLAATAEAPDPDCGAEQCEV